MKIITIPEREIGDYTEDDFGGKRNNPTVCVVRYGAFGDIIQISSILPLLKEQGYRVCVNVTERGYDILKSDPNVDELLVQKSDQVSNDRLTEYWEEMSKYFDKFIQLSESVEKELLLVPDRLEILDGEPVLVQANENYHKSKEEIHSLCNVNYMERTHDMAGVPHKFNPKFYPTKKEESWASEVRRRIKTKHVVMWALSGSSVHKVYPWTDIVIFTLLNSRKDVTFVTVGDDWCKILEAGWEKEKRIITKSGKWSIRETLAFLGKCNVVVGPETGVLNAASTLNCHKTVMLSHSSEENLSKHWKNTTTLEPSNYENFCFPCHKIHFGFKTCNRDKETGGAMCAVNIKPDTVVSDISRNLR